VRDTGIGFDEQTRERLFQRFEQADASITRRFGGTGLGLAICRSLTELMGGRIEAQSSPGEGSTFSVTLPLEHIGAPAAADRTTVAKPATAVPAGGLRILLAEDHPTNQRVVQMIVEASGHRLVIADNGRAALELLQDGGFDVVLMDMQMPEMDGLSATRALRALEGTRGGARTPVIMLTANALEEHVRAGRAAGADAHISKPIRASALLETIAQVLAGQTSQPAAVA
jgi:CheY-like chemotaxis protein